MEMTILPQLAVATGLGLLVGLQRQRTADEVAGVRTFPLITLLGLGLAILSDLYGGWLLAAGLLSVLALIVAGNVARWRGRPEPDHGITTEVAALVMYGVGAAVGAGLTAPAVVTTGLVAALLHWRDPLHELAERMGDADFDAVVRFGLIALVILPALPDRDYGPFAVLNPFEIWLMVVLIVGISLAGYVAFKLFGARTGAVVAGILGGLISSTATAVSYARRSAEDPDRSPAAAVVVTLASMVVFVRVLVEIAVVAPGIFWRTAPPLAALGALLLALSLALLVRAPGDHAAEARDPEPPSDLKSAVMFGALYAAVLFAVSFAREYLGSGGLYAVAALSGLTDMDAITLSTAQMVKGGALSTDTGWRLILVGSLTNLVFKAGVVASLGHARLRRRIFAVFSVAIAGGVAILLFWPD
ncbi:MAG TPA: MgtC/SapB family protein [Longimicrobiales bacterium]|nr:MgtC/SapB family protein [Longimicrobiales bacterium]